MQARLLFHPAMPNGEPAHHRVDLGDVELHYVEQGEGRPVVLLHGFPEFWHTWHRLIPDLANAGYRVFAPDQRGYNLSSKPKGIDAYEIEKLLSDVVRFVKQVAGGRASLVAHDWGGGPAWYAAMQHPEIVERLVILDSPHPERFASHIYRFPQILKSWYMFAMRIPWIPELLFSAFDYALPRAIVTKGTLRKDAYTKEELELYHAAWAQPGVWTATINWYRALIRRGPKGVAHLIKPTDVPSLIVWGMKDTALGHEMAEPRADLVPNARVEKLPNAGHFVHADDPERVHRLILDYLAES